MGSKRRVFPIDPPPPSAHPPSAHGSRRSPPPRTPLQGARPQLQELNGSGAMDRLFVMRAMRQENQVTSISSGSAVALSGAKDDISAAQNHKDRKAAEAKRRDETRLMQLEDYTDKPEGFERLKRQEERSRMQEEELRMARLLAAERAQLRELKLLAEKQEEARLREFFMAKLAQERAEQERIAAEKEAARKAALELKMKALKEAADAQAQEEYAARQREKQQHELEEKEHRLMAVETVSMELEDALGAAMRQQLMAELERKAQIAVEEVQWKVFEAQEAQKQLEATVKRRAAQAQQYELDRQRRIEIHRLQKERAGAAERQRHNKFELSEARLTPSQHQKLLPNDKIIALEQVNQTLPDRSVVPAEKTSEKPDSPQDQEERIQPEPSDSDKITNSVDPAMPDRATIEIHSSDIEENDPIASVQESRSDGDILISANASAEESGSVEDSPVDGEPSREGPPMDLAEALAAGLAPFAQLQSVISGSPAMDAALQPGDLLVQFGGISRSTPQCLLAIADCVKRNVNQTIKLLVLRPLGPDELLFRQHALKLVPRKWTGGKGLLGCNLSAFKFPEDADLSDAILSTGCGDSEPSQRHDGTALSSETPSLMLVLHDVRPESMAELVGIRDGDLLMGCGSILQGDLAVVVDYLRLMRSQQEILLDIQRWLPEDQQYEHVNVVLPVSIDPLGCALTTYAEYYSTADASVSTQVQSACLECYYTTHATALHAAALNGHVACLEALMAAAECLTQEEQSNELDWRDEDGRTPLFYASYAQQRECVEFLLSCMKTHTQTNELDTEALSVSLGQETGWSSSCDLYGDTPLHAAASNGSREILTLLLQSGEFHVNMVNYSQVASVHLAADVATLQLLCERFEADSLAVDAEGRMPLAFAVLRGDTASVEYLCTRHPDFCDYADAQGNTPLHLAASIGHEPSVQVLLHYLPTIALFMPNANDLNALQVAQANRWTSLAELLDRAMNHDSEFPG